MPPTTPTSGAAAADPDPPADEPTRYEHIPYEHIQRGPLLVPLLLLGLALVLLGASLGSVSFGAVLLIAIGLGLALAALAFSRLTTRVDPSRDALELRFGPLPLASRTVALADVRGVEVARSKWIDGWGIHGLPGRGPTWNVWGFDCIELALAGGRRLRIGTDDAAGLVRALRARIGSPG
jgi:hypothetical protein